ncbi:MAG: EVE domain-containing protein [Gammaproteobacteria bacterium]|nr:EVE domain-containing protein [Gammaproteobacteria bacterium]
MAYWLMKSEPDAYSIDDLERDGREPWDGIRNYQARNMMRDDMKIGDEVFFYHSNCKEPGIVGIMKVASEPYPDPTQFDRKSNYYDPKSPRDDPRWCLVDVEFVRKLGRTITLSEIKAARGLDGLILTRKGNRLSIMPIEKKHWNKLLSLE